MSWLVAVVCLAEVSLFSALIEVLLLVFLQKTASVTPTSLPFDFVLLVFSLFTLARKITANIAFLDFLVSDCAMKSVAPISSS